MAIKRVMNTQITEIAAATSEELAWSANDFIAVITELAALARRAIELASLQDFLPALPGWRDRSVFIKRQGEISFYHYDFTAQALAKLSRSYDRDISDVQAMYEQKLFSWEKLGDCFEAIESELIRFPSLNPELLRNKVEQFIGNCKSTLERDN